MNAKSSTVTYKLALFMAFKSSNCMTMKLFSFAETSAFMNLFVNLLCYYVCKYIYCKILKIAPLECKPLPHFLAESEIILLS